MGAVTPSRLMSLPVELRDQVYSHILRPANNAYECPNFYTQYKYDLRLFRVCKQMQAEAQRVFRLLNIFVAIETPWTEAEQHVRTIGYVPILIRDRIAERFNNWSMKIAIDVPKYNIPLQVQTKFILLLDDLHRFTESWFYSDLSHPGLNNNLRLKLYLQDPYAPSYEQRALPKAVQQRLLLPFRLIKGLDDLEVHGESYPSIVKAMKDGMAEEYKPAEACLEDATRLKDEGNAALQNGLYHEAIALYEKSFLEIHIVCAGRRRSIFGDNFFERAMTTGQFKGLHGQMLRLVLRVRLVANTVLAYLKLKDFDSARFWGLRTINLIRDSLGADEEEVVTDFIAAPELGKIYYRTALACREMGSRKEALDLMKVAIRYLPHDATIKRDLADLGTLPDRLFAGDW